MGLVQKVQHKWITQNCKLKWQQGKSHANRKWGGRERNVLIWIHRYMWIPSHYILRHRSWYQCHKWRHIPHTHQQLSNEHTTLTTEPHAMHTRCPFPTCRKLVRTYRGWKTMVSLIEWHNLLNGAHMVPALKKNLCWSDKTKKLFKRELWMGGVSGSTAVEQQYQGGWQGSCCHSVITPFWPFFSDLRG